MMDEEMLKEIKECIDIFNSQMQEDFINFLAEKQKKIKRRSLLERAQLSFAKRMKRRAQSKKKRLALRAKENV